MLRYYFLDYEGEIVYFIRVIKIKIFNKFFDAFYFDFHKFFKKTCVDYSNSIAIK